VLFHRWFPVVAAVIATIYGLVTPPLQAPDEVGHYWRSVAIGHGELQPSIVEGRPYARVPAHARDLVGALWVPTAGRTGREARIGVERLQHALQLRASMESVEVLTPALYTPLPYLPQALTLRVAEEAGVRPLLAFYLARVANAFVALLLVWFAAASFPVLGVVALPMTLYLFGSLSPDVLTIALATHATALAQRAETKREWIILTVVAAALAASKLVYLFVPLIALCNRSLTRSRSLFLVLAIAAGAVLSVRTAATSGYVPRPDAITNPEAQRTLVLEHPIRFATIAASDYVRNTPRYANEFIGRLGWLDIGLPKPLTAAALLLLVLGAALTAQPLTSRQRVAGAAIVIATCSLISFSQYLVWTPLGATRIDGIQGRYFLPIAPLALTLLGQRKLAKYQTRLIVAFAVVVTMLHAVAIARIVARYY
jgi:uncharacterized membrane protein